MAGAGIDVFQVAPESTYVTFAACCRLAPCRSSSCGTELPSEKSSLMDKRSEKSLRRDAEYHIASLQPTNDITTLLARKDAGWPPHRLQMSLSRIHLQPARGCALQIASKEGLHSREGARLTLHWKKFGTSLTWLLQDYLSIPGLSQVRLIER